MLMGSDMLFCYFRLFLGMGGGGRIIVDIMIQNDRFPSVWKNSLAAVTFW